MPPRPVLCLAWSLASFVLAGCAEEHEPASPAAQPPSDRVDASATEAGSDGASGEGAARDGASGEGAARDGASGEDAARDGAAAATPCAPGNSDGSFTAALPDFPLFGSALDVCGRRYIAWCGEVAFHFDAQGCFAGMWTLESLESGNPLPDGYAECLTAELAGRCSACLHNGTRRHYVSCTIL